MKKSILPLLLFSLFSFSATAQDSALPQNFLFDDSDIIVTAPKEPEKEKAKIDIDKEARSAVASARDLLNQKPLKLQQKAFPSIKNKIATIPTVSKPTNNLTVAPFGLLWGSSIADTRSSGVQLANAEMKDYVNSFLATRLPKPIAFFNKVYLVYGKEDELYRILAYSELIDDDASASKVLTEYQSYSTLLKQKYGNQAEDFTPAKISKTIKNDQGRDEVIQQDAPLGNPDFLAQLQAGTAVLFSTYHNNEIAAALSIGVDGDKKSYIVIDYKNLHILKKHEAKMLDAL